MKVEEVDDEEVDEAAGAYETVLNRLLDLEEGDDGIGEVHQR